MRYEEAIKCEVKNEMQDPINITRNILDFQIGKVNFFLKKIMPSAQASYAVEFYDGNNGDELCRLVRIDNDSKRHMINDLSYYQMWLFVEGFSRIAGPESI